MLFAFYVVRTDASFQSWLKRGVTFISTDYVLPPEICCMLNVIIDAKGQAHKLCTIDGIDMVIDAISSLRNELFQAQFDRKKNGKCRK